MAQARGGARFDWRGLLVLVGIYLVVVVLWPYPVIYPLKVFVVLCHEMSHGIAALVTGGNIVQIEVSDQLGGLTVTRGGAPLVITSAGYLGSLLFGVALLLVGTRTRLAPQATAALGILVTLVAWRYMPPDTFGRRFAAVMGVLLVALAAVRRPVPEIALRVLGITSCLYAILDIKEDVLDTEHTQSDAALLEQQTGVPAYVWGVLWIGVSLVVTVVAAKWAVTGPPATDEKKRKRA